MNYKEIENAWKVQEIRQNKCKDLEEENRNLKEKVEQMQENYENLNDAYTEILWENNKLKKNIERYEKEETRYIKKIKNLEMIKKENESQISCYFKERDTLREKIRFLEECLDRKERINQRLREEIGKFIKDWK